VPQFGRAGVPLAALVGDVVAVRTGVLVGDGVVAIVVVCVGVGEPGNVAVAVRVAAGVVPAFVGTGVGVNGTALRYGVEMYP